MNFFKTLAIFLCVFMLHIFAVPTHNSWSSTIATIIAVAATKLLFKSFCMGACIAYIATASYGFPISVLLLIGGGDFSKMTRTIVENLNGTSIFFLVAPLLFGIGCFVAIEKMQQGNVSELSKEK